MSDCNLVFGIKAFPSSDAQFIFSNLFSLTFDDVPRCSRMRCYQIHGYGVVCGYYGDHIQNPTYAWRQTVFRWTVSDEPLARQGGKLYHVSHIVVLDIEPVDVTDRL